MLERNEAGLIQFKPEPTGDDAKSEPYDPACGRYASQIEGLSETAADSRLTAAEYLKQEEGTYNIRTNHFLCDMCYIGAGMPSRPGGWLCP
jgi:hypothetical protein